MSISNARLERLKTNKLSKMIVPILMILACGFVGSPHIYGQQSVRVHLVAKADRKPAPAFHLVSATGKTVQISDYRGKIVLLNFWATKCGGCILEIPSLVEIQKAFERSGFTAVGISEDISYSGLNSAGEAWQQVRPFMVSHSINYPILMGNDAIVDAYGLSLYPTTYLIDGSGKIAAIYAGVIDMNDLEANIKALLAKH